MQVSPPSSPGLCLFLPAISPQRSDVASDQQNEEEECILQSLGKYFQSIHTKKDFERYVTGSEDSYKQEMQVLKSELQGIGDRVDEVERQCTDISSCGQDHHSAIQYVLHRDEEHTSHLDDIENRNRHNNIRVRGIPESVLHKDLDPTLDPIFATFF